jgi:hypothetical protein
MNFRKFAADHLFDGYQWLEDVVLITDEDGRVQDIISAG